MQRQTVSPQDAIGTLETTNRVEVTAYQLIFKAPETQSRAQKARVKRKIVVCVMRSEQ